MKLGIWYWLTSSVICAAGVGLMIGGYVMHRSDDTRKNETVTVMEDFSDLDISLTESTLVLHVSDKADTASVQFTNAPGTAAAVVENGVLRITDTKKPLIRFFSFGISAQDTDSEIAVTLPEAAYADVLISLGYADENVIKELSCESLQVDMGVGDLEMETLGISGTFAFSGGTGDLEIKKLNAAGTAHIELGVGDCEMKNCEFMEDLVIDGGTGDAELEKVVIQGALDVDLGVGVCKADSLRVNGTSDIDCGTGDLEIKNSLLCGMTVDCGVGSVSMKDTELNGDAEFSQGMGDISLGLKGEAEDYYLDCDQGVGDIQADDIPMGSPLQDDAHAIRIDGGVGSVQITVKD